MGYSFTDLGAEGCRRSLNALLMFDILVSFAVKWETDESEYGAYVEDGEIDGLEQERRNSSAVTMELGLFLH